MCVSGVVCLLPQYQTWPSLHAETAAGITEFVIRNIVALIIIETKHIEFTRDQIDAVYRKHGTITSESLLALWKKGFAYVGMNSIEKAQETADELGKFPQALFPGGDCWTICGQGLSGNAHPCHFSGWVQNLSVPSF